MKMANEYIKRGLTAKLEALLTQFPVVILTGARQAGKSTLTQHLASSKERRYLTLDDLDILERALHQPETLVQEKQAITLDEIQRAPKLLLSIKREVDKQRIPGRFLITGSANLLLMKRVGETLAGRAVYLTLNPLTELEKSGDAGLGLWPLLAESKNSDTLLQQLRIRPPKKFSWKEATLQGGYPSAVLSQSEEERTIWMDGYIRTYLERDIQQLVEISHLTDFRRLMRVAALRTGQLLNQAELARDAGLAPATAHRYLNLLEISYQVEKIPAFSGNRTKRLIKTPKFYWGDTGICSFLRGKKEGDGALLENWWLRQMDVWREATIPHPQIYYWRTASGQEVDFVIEHQQKLIPVEIKMAQKIYSSDLKNLQIFLEEYPKQASFGLIIYGGPELQPVSKNILAIPLHFFA